MHIGIRAYGVSIPFYRLERAQMFDAWKTLPFPTPGERTVANYDEDSLTLMVDSAIDCLSGVERQRIDGLLCASTTFPYMEKLASATAATALDLAESIRTADFANSLRGMTIAMNFALDAVAAGSSQNVVVSAADCRLGAPGGELEQTIGDGGVSFLFGREDVIAEIRERHTVTDEFSGMWRSNRDDFVRLWEDRMTHDEGYSKIMPLAIASLLKKTGLGMKDIDKVVCDTPADIRRLGRLAKTMGMSEEQVQDPCFESIGNTGTSFAGMLLVAALEQAQPGDKMLVASYGNGADVFLIEVTPAITQVRNRGTFTRKLKVKRKIPNYASYLKWRELVEIDEGRRPGLPPTSIANLHRNVKILVGLYGVKCRHCGTLQYRQQGGMPSSTMPQRVCIKCGSRDEFEDYRFAEKLGRVYSYTQDKLAVCPDPPLSAAVVDFEGGGRGVFELTDRDPSELRPGMPVRMVFRRLYYDRGIHNYYWKATPVRQQQA